jgi:hypothetical protein
MTKKLREYNENSEDSNLLIRRLENDTDF